MIPRLRIGEEFECVGCGIRSRYEGRCIRSVHVFAGDGFLNFCKRRCEHTEVT